MMAPGALRVLQTVAYVSEDGAYGGPVAVACDQGVALHATGVSVTMASGWDGRARKSLPVPVRLFRAWQIWPGSFASLIAPGFIGWLVRRVRDFDLVHVHFARDLVTLPSALAALLFRRPLVIQSHGMVRPDPRLGVRALDWLIVSRVLRSAKAVIALTEDEVESLNRLGVKRNRIRLIGNGVPTSSSVAVPSASGPTVVYASRLAARKRPVAFVQAAAIVNGIRGDVRFEIWGPDGGELEAVTREISALSLEEVCTYRGAVSHEEMRAILAQSQVFVLPSRDEPFPMALLEALSAGVPSVITSETGVSERVRLAGAATVTDGSSAALAAAILELVADPEKWARMSRAAREVVESDFSLDRVAALLNQAYAEALAKG